MVFLLKVEKKQFQRQFHSWVKTKQYSQKLILPPDIKDTSVRPNPAIYCITWICNQS